MLKHKIYCAYVKPGKMLVLDGLFRHDVGLSKVRHVGVILVETQLGRVPALALEVIAEALILMGDGILADIRNEEEGNNRRQQRQTRRDPERVLRRLRLVAARLLDIRKDPGADKGANLAHSGSDAVVPTADARRARLGRQETNVVAGAQLAEGHEDAVHDGEGGDLRRDLVVHAREDVADDGLRGDAEDEGVLGADPVGDEGADQGAREVEDVDDGVPAEDGGERRVVAVDAAEDG